MLRKEDNELNKETLKFSMNAFTELLISNDRDDTACLARFVWNQSMMALLALVSSTYEEVDVI
jgi:hypothetical protein